MFRLAAAQNSAQKSLKFIVIQPYDAKFSEFFDSNFIQLGNSGFFKPVLRSSFKRRATCTTHY